jgi:hypothetical protein
MRFLYVPVNNFRVMSFNKKAAPVVSDSCKNLNNSIQYLGKLTCE